MEFFPLLLLMTELFLGVLFQNFLNGFKLSVKFPVFYVSTESLEERKMFGPRWKFLGILKLNVTKMTRNSNNSFFLKYFIYKCYIPVRLNFYFILDRFKISLYNNETSLLNLLPLLVCPCPCPCPCPCSCPYLCPCPCP